MLASHTSERYPPDWPQSVAYYLAGFQFELSAGGALNGGIPAGVLLNQSESTPAPLPRIVYAKSALEFPAYSGPHDEMMPRQVQLWITPHDDEIAAVSTRDRPASEFLGPSAVDTSGGAPFTATHRTTKTIPLSRVGFVRLGCSWLNDPAWLAAAMPVRGSFTS